MIKTESIMDNEFIKQKQDRNNYPLYHFGKEYHSLAYKAYKQFDYKSHLKFSILSAWYYLTNNYPFIPGGIELINGFYNFQNPLIYTGASFLKKCISKEKLEESNVNIIVNEYFNGYKGDIYKILNYGKFPEINNNIDKNYLFEITNKFNVELLISRINNL